MTSANVSSAGDCAVCGCHAKKRYGGLGRYVAMCGECWDAVNEASRLSTDEAAVVHKMIMAGDAKPKSKRGRRKAKAKKAKANAGYKTPIVRQPPKAVLSLGEENAALRAEQARNRRAQELARRKGLREDFVPRHVREPGDWRDERQLPRKAEAVEGHAE